ncbi:MAG: hypothetical protein ACRDJO_08435 [Actinomycetota bacterium]
MDALVVEGSFQDTADLAMAKRLAEVLDKHYPGHTWAVNVDSKQGIATVQNLRLSGRWGFYLKLRDLTYHDEIEREAMRAGGELLERYGLQRGRFRQSQYQALPTTPVGDLILDAA